MIRVTKEEGKQLNQVCPQFVHRTTTKRSYFLVEVPEALNQLKKIQSQHTVGLEK